MCWYLYHFVEKNFVGSDYYEENIDIAKKKGVSSKTHSMQQLNDYANQHNPNNKAYKARVESQYQTSEKSVP